MIVRVLMRRRVDLWRVGRDTVGIAIGIVAMVGVVTGRVVMGGAVIVVVVLIGTVPATRIDAGRAGDALVFLGQVRVDVRVRKGQPRRRHRGEQREQGRDDAKLAGTGHDGR